jgi:hypothetical protein
MEASPRANLYKQVRRKLQKSSSKASKTRSKPGPEAAAEAPNRTGCCHSSCFGRQPASQAAMEPNSKAEKLSTSALPVEILAGVPLVPDQAYTRSLKDKRDAENRARSNHGPSAEKPQPGSCWQGLGRLCCCRTV